MLIPSVESLFKFGAFLPKIRAALATFFLITILIPQSIANNFLPLALFNHLL